LKPGYKAVDNIPADIERRAGPSAIASTCLFHAAVLDTLQLAEDGHYTVFAPSNLAFDKLQPSVKDKVLSQDGCGPGTLLRLHRE